MKNLRIYKAFPAYQNYLDKYYRENVELNNKTFIEQRQELIHDGFPWIFSWSTSIGNTEVDLFETVHNCEGLQKTWNTGNKEKIYNDWQIEIVVEQIVQFKPDICILYPPELFTEQVILRIKDALKGKTLFVGYDGMNRMNINIYKPYDLIITCSDYISEYYKLLGKPTYTLNFCFDDSILSKINTSNKPKFNLGFSGSIYSQVHDYRYQLLKHLTRYLNVEIRSEFGNENNYSLLSKRQLKMLLKKRDLSNYLALWRISKANKGPIFGLEMFQFLHDSKISLNMHGDHIHFAANARLFEITGVGSCMLTDWKENIADIFIPDKEIMTYKSYEEAVDKTKFLLKNNSIREKIAFAGQKKTLERYTYKKSIPELFSFLKTFYYSR